MAEKLLKILYVFMAFVNVFLYGVSFILKLNMVPIQVDLSGLSAVEKREMLSNLAINYPLGEQLLSTAIKLSIILAIILVVYVVGKIMKKRKLKQVGFDVKAVRAPYMNGSKLVVVHHRNLWYTIT